MKTIPNFSTKIGDAWILVEKLMSEGFGFSVGGGRVIGVLKWACIFVGPEGQHISAESDASAPHAICLAALKVREQFPLGWRNE